MHIAFLVDDATFEAAHQRLLESGTSTYADPSRNRPGEINHRFGGRGVYFDDPDGHFFELLTAAPPPEPAAEAASGS
jgi:catechol 2,3-dioxygenase-like lactoylglutathione lyase family enzyme